MSLPADMSLMDILFDRDDPVLKFVNDRDAIKQDLEAIDPKTEIISDKLDNWNTDPDIFQEFLNDEQFNFLEKNMDDYQNSHLDIAFSDWKPIVNDANSIKDVDFCSSTLSDSGISSDQVSPDLQNDYDFKSCHLDDDDDEHLSSAVSTISDTSVNCLTVNDIKQEPQDMDCDPAEDEQAVLGIIADEQHVNTNQKKVQQIVNVAPMVTTNPRSILLPVNTGNGIRTYKIVSNANGRKTLKAIGSLGNGNSVVLKAVRPVGVPLVVKNFKSNGMNKKMKKRIPHEETDEEEITVLSDSEDDKKKSQYPRLILSPEEKKLIQKEGVSLPSHYPLTKFEERELKRIRRKIRNKISAQDSRKRKKEYLDGLEDRVKQCTEENLSLVKKIKFLQSQNQSLIAQLKKLQITLARTTTKTAQPATCLMVLLLSVALVMAPNLRLNQNNESDVTEQEVSDNSITRIAGRSRSLLSKANPPDECAGTDEEEKMGEIHDLLNFHSNPSLSPYSSDVESSNQGSFSTTSERSRKSSYRSSSSGYESPPDFLVDHDYDPPPSKRNRINFDAKDLNMFEEALMKKEFIIPPVDDVWPGQSMSMSKVDDALKPKEFIIPEVDDEWVPSKSVLTERIEDFTTEVKVNISDAKGTRTVVIKVPKENK